MLLLYMGMGSSFPYLVFGQCVLTLASLKVLINTIVT